MDHHCCYHCGQPVLDTSVPAVQIDDVPRLMCCYGCQAVAQAIVDHGLVSYYHCRDAMPEGPREVLPTVLSDLKAYDHARFQQRFVQTLGEHEREVSLLLEGITCAACVWLNEQYLSRLAGVNGVDVNYATRRARVRWDVNQLSLSDILSAVAAIGYRAYPYDPELQETLAKKERRDALWRLFVAGFGMMQVMMYAVPVYLAGAGEMAPDIEQLMRWASLVLTVPVMFYSAAPFFRNAWRDIRLRRVGMDVPVAMGIGAAFAASVWATLRATGEVYFDSVTMFVFFLLGGRFLEMRARQKAIGVTEALGKLMPVFADYLPDYPQSGESQQVLATDLLPGQCARVKPGAPVPADGLVLSGESAVDESLLTGESLPLSKHAGDLLTGGAINCDGPLVMRVTQVGEATRLSAIVRLMERAASEKPKMVAIADRVAARFVLAVLLIALLTGLFWSGLAPERALWITVSVLVVTCPCALSLAMPMALAVANGVLARCGLLATRAQAVEALARANHFVFDKTGTLTLGVMRLVEVHLLGHLSEHEVLSLASALEAASEHPLAKALRQAGEAMPGVEALSNVPGQGVCGSWQGKNLRLGRLEWISGWHGRPIPHEYEAILAHGDTVLALADESGWLAFLRVGDLVRPDAGALIAALKQAGCGVSLLSGDARPVAMRVAEVLGIDDVHAACSPQDKYRFVSSLQARGITVVMVGDGVNDAPVLAQADVSVAMGEGADLARAQADLVLLSGHLIQLHTGLLTARRALRIIRQNLLWSFAYNFLTLPLAMFGYVSPWLAGIGMSGSSLLVVLNSLRLQRVRR